jgi:hypothetical protein
MVPWMLIKAPMNPGSRKSFRITMPKHVCTNFSCIIYFPISFQATTLSYLKDYMLLYELKYYALL